MTDRAAGRALGEPANRLRYAAPTGTVLISWDGARQPTMWYLASLFPSRSGELQALRWEDVDARGTALGEAAAFHRAQLDALDVLDAPAAPDAAGTSPLAAETADRTDGVAERAEAAERPGPE
jgi:hypothetical protein